MFEKEEWNLWSGKFMVRYIIKGYNILIRVMIGKIGIIMFVMKIKLNHNPVLNMKVKHTTKPQTYKYQKKHQFYRSLPTCTKAGSSG